MHCGLSFRPDAADEPENKKRAAAFGWKFDPIVCAVWIVGFVAIYVLLFILPVHPVHFPLRRLWYVYLGLIVSSACLVFIDAENLDTKLEIAGVPEFTSWHWFLLTLLAWPVGFPLYLLARAQFGQLALIRAGMGAAGTFCLLAILSIIVISSRSARFYKATAASSKPTLTIHGQPVTTPNAAKPGIVIISSGTQVIRME
jgi:hypothetical protein